jgi:hypothetical protein
MRFIAAIAIVVPILAVAYVLTRGPRPEPAAQVAARHAADSLTRGRLAALERGDVEAWGAALRPDALLLGDDADPARTGPVEAVAEMRRELGPVTAERSAPDLSIGRLIAGGTRRGRLAWTAVDLNEDGLSRPLRQTAAYVLRDDEWRVLIEHHSQAPTWEALQAGAAARQFPAPATLGEPDGRGDAAQLAKRFRRSLGRFGRMRVDRGAIAVGPTQGDVALGDSAVSAMFAGWERRLGAPRLAPEGLRTWVPRRSGVGWVAANLEVSPPDWGGVTLPLRFTGVYRSRGEDSWGLVLAHLSVAVPDTKDEMRAAAAQAGP